MRLTKITNDLRGGSRFEEVEIAQATTPYAENVPPMLISAAMAATGGVVFVTTPAGVRETEPHPAPRRRLIVVLEGELEGETTDGDKRTVGPGMVVLVEDVGGRGHVTRVVSPTSATFMAIPLAD
jgi:hypothetical protein